MHEGQKTSTAVASVYVSSKLAVRQEERNLNTVWALAQGVGQIKASRRRALKWARKYKISEGGATHHRAGVSITASAYKRCGNEAPGSDHADLSISCMHYSLHTAILPPCVASKDWFRFLFICFSPSPIRLLLLPFCSFSIKLRQARHQIHAAEAALMTIRLRVRQRRRWALLRWAGSAETLFQAQITRRS